MNLQQTHFIHSANHPDDFIIDQGREIAFAGRSNAGKSTAINVLCHQKNLARTSKTPGRTQLINFFQVDEHLRLVDLPGYGFAKSAHKQRQHWSHLIEQYYLRRNSLIGTMLMMDVRHPMKEADEQMLSWCQHCQCPVHILLTKADKLSKNQASSQLLRVRKTCSSYMGVSAQLFSGLRKTGLTEALDQIQRWAEKTNPGAV